MAALSCSLGSNFDPSYSKFAIKNLSLFLSGYNMCLLQVGADQSVVRLKRSTPSETWCNHGSVPWQPPAQRRLRPQPEASPIDRWKVSPAGLGKEICLVPAKFYWLMAINQYSWQDETKSSSAREGWKIMKSNQNCCNYWMWAQNEHFSTSSEEWGTWVLSVGTFETIRTAGKTCEKLSR